MIFPVAGVEVHPLAVVFVGFTVGVAGSFLGVGGGFIATPALNILGFPMSYAVGTDLAHMMGKSIVATLRHRLLGNVDFKLGGLMVLGTIPGVELGKTIVLHLDRTGQAGPVIRYVYIALLAGVFLAFLRDYLKRRSSSKRSAPQMQDSGRGAWALRLVAPPFVSLPRSRIDRVSLWAIIGVGLVTGLAAGFLGVGGGFIRMAALLYLLGVPTLVAIGTDLFEIVVSGGYGAFTYALAGRVDLLAALVMLSGAAIGAWIGASATVYVKGNRIRLYLAGVVLAAAVATALKQLAESLGSTTLSTAGNYLIFGAGGLLVAVISLSWLRGVRREGQRSAANQSNGQ
ncbi:MAG: sulfite exporter TauE/SafE family protein [Chloroflexota bacterium]